MATAVPPQPQLLVLLLGELGRTGEGASRGRSLRAMGRATSGEYTEAGGRSPSPSFLCFSPPESWEPKRDFNLSTSSWIR